MRREVHAVPREMRDTIGVGKSFSGLGRPRCHSWEGWVLAREGTGHPMEDAARYDFANGILAVSDGVSRNHGGVYPRGESSSVRAVADVFCREAMDGLRVGDGPGLAARIADFGRRVNGRIRAFQESVLPRPAEFAGARDPYGVVGAVAVLGEDGVLRFGWIGDCGVAVHRRGRWLRVTENQVAGAQAHLDGIQFSGAEERTRYVRAHLRNGANPGLYPVFGVLNGDPVAPSFWRSGSLDLLAGDLVVVFSDGAEGLLADPGVEAALSDASDPGRFAAAQTIAVARSLRLREQAGSAAVDDLTLLAALTAGVPVADAGGSAS